jgi:VWFA-related protein
MANPRRSCLLILLTTWTVASISGQQAPTFRSGTNLVQVQVVVTDKNGAPVRGLAAGDFEVKENGRPQIISNVSFVDIAPPDPADTTGLPSDIGTNDLPAQGRVYVLVLDGPHVDPLGSTKLRAIAKSFVESSLGPNDVAAVVHVGQPHLGQTFTSDRALLIRSINQFIGRKVESAVSTITNDRMLRPQIDAPVDTNLGSRADDARLTLITLRQLCRTLASAATGARRSVVLFGEGVDLDVTNLIGTDTHGAGGSGTSSDSARFASDVVLEERALIDAARRADVAFYTVDPRGNSAGEGDLITLQTAPGADVHRELSRGQRSLRGLADLTGGLAIVGVNDATKALRNIVVANSTYYIVAYAPDQSRDDGKFRSIDVSVKRQAVSVVHRQGYFAAAAALPVSSTGATKTIAVAGASPEIRAALASELPVQGLGVRVTAAPVGVLDKTATVAVSLEIDTERLQFSQAGGLAVADIEMAFAVIDEDGKIKAGNRSRADLKLPFDQVRLIPGLRRLYEATVPRGKYHLRVAACEVNGPCGSAMIELDAAAGKPDVFLGPVLLTSQSAQAFPTAGRQPSIEKWLPSPAIAMREFQRSGTLSALALVVVNGKTTEPVSVVTTVTGAGGREEFTTTTKRAVGAVGPLVIDIPLSTLSPGPHVLTFTARLPSGQPTARSVPFEVR